MQILPDVELWGCPQGTEFEPSGFALHDGEIGWNDSAGQELICRTLVNRGGLSAMRPLLSVAGMRIEL